MTRPIGWARLALVPSRPNGLTAAESWEGRAARLAGPGSPWLQYRWMEADGTRISAFCFPSGSGSRVAHGFSRVTSRVQSAKDLDSIGSSRVHGSKTPQGPLLSAPDTEPRRASINHSRFGRF